MNDLDGLKRQMEECIENAFDKGYKKGIEHAHIKNDTVAEEKVKEAYGKGLEDAWECAKKITFCTRDGGLPTEVLENIFDKGYYALKYISNKYTVQEVVSRIKEYEKKRIDDIKVGDEVYYTDENHPRVVTAIYRENESFGGNLKAVQITESGKYVVDNVADLHRTGRHFLQIAEVLADLRS